MKVGSYKRQATLCDRSRHAQNSGTVINVLPMCLFLSLFIPLFRSSFVPFFLSPSISSFIPFFLPPLFLSCLIFLSSPFSLVSFSSWFFPSRWSGSVGELVGLVFAMPHHRYTPTYCRSRASSLEAHCTLGTRHIQKKKWSKVTSLSLSTGSETTRRRWWKC